MIQRVICNPVVRMLVAITAILGYAHSSAYAQGSRHRGLVTPHLISPPTWEERRPASLAMVSLIRSLRTPPPTGRETPA